MDARASGERPRRRRRAMHPRTATAVVRVACCCCALLSSAAGFSPSAIAPQRATITMSTSTRHVHNNNNSPRRTTRLRNLFDDFDGDGLAVEDDEFDDFEGYDPAVSAQIRKAKQLLVDAKKKQEAAAAKSSADGTSGHSGGHDGGEALPFFATQSLAATASQSSAKIKSKLASGAIVADGDAMSSLAQSEPWERRSLGQMFRREAREDYDGNTVEGDDIDGRALGDKDLARNIFNLRRQLQDGDFKQVFDSRNRFIGEVD